MPKIPVKSGLVIQVRGTSGSGKSTVIRQVVDEIEPLEEWEANFITDRKQPLYYRNALNDRGIYLLGHYESQCGGCDNVGSAAKVFKLIKSVQEHSDSRGTILCEGLLLSEDTKWSQQIQNLHVVYLNTPIETCIKQIKARRLAAGNEKPLNEENTRKRVAVIERSRVKLIGLGIKCYSLDFGSAVEKVLELINAK